MGGSCGYDYKEIKHVLNTKKMIKILFTHMNRKVTARMSGEC